MVLLHKSILCAIIENTIIKDKGILKTTHQFFIKLSQNFYLVYYVDVVYNYTLYSFNINNALFNNKKITSIL